MVHPVARRTVLKSLAATATAAALPCLSAAEEQSPLIIDTHQHLWDLKKLKLPWLAGAPEVLKHTFHLPEYAAATAGLNVRSVYMEVYVADDHLVTEADHVLEICRGGQAPTIGAVIGGRPESPDFAKYVERYQNTPEIKGIRRVLHEPETPAGHCLKDTFVHSVRLLGERGLSFDLCMRPTELGDAAKLTELCPDTRFIVDHCGNADAKAFGAGDGKAEPWHKADEWKAGMDRLAKRPNVICKISGVIARLPQGGTVDHLAPIVNHCLDAFGPDRVVFGSDWPVCLLGGKLQTWVDYLTQIISQRPEREQRLLWSGNAIRHYALKIPQ